MEENKCKPFPYEYQELDDEDKQKINKVFKSPNMDFVRLKPTGCIVYRNYEIDAQNIYNMPLRKEDIFIMSYQRSGTTWTQELIWLLANNLDYAGAAAKSIAHRCPFLEYYMFYNKEGLADMTKALEGTRNKEDALEILRFSSTPVTGTLAAMPSPRFIKTHLTLALLPPTLLDTSKVVYIARDPRDVAVSSYHQAKMFESLYGLVGTFKEYWNLFVNDLLILTPYFDNVKEMWEKRHHPNVLFLFYEELIKDLPAVVRRAADFLGKKLTTEELNRLCDHLSMENFKKNKSVNYEEMKELGFFSADENFIRKGKAGGWHGYFDEKMKQQAERWIQDNLRDTDLRFPL